MAELIYDASGRLIFTPEMKKEYTILMPQMLPIHFGMFRQLFALEGYRVMQLENTGRSVVEQGLHYVHNDTCYPALLVIGQFLDAISHYQLDPHKVALLITQTGGGCRASNYIHLLRKALERANLAFIPVISLSFGMEKNTGWKLTLPLLRRMVYAMLYGDVMMNLANQVRPYEQTSGETDALLAQWSARLVEGFQAEQYMRRREMRRLFATLCQEFGNIPVTATEKIRVGIVGEIYIKYSPLGNNHLEEFLRAEGVEPVVLGLTDFIIFKIYNRLVDIDLYGGSFWKKRLLSVAKTYIEACQQDMIAAFQASRFRAPSPFSDLQKRIRGYLGAGNKMGEGWLLTAEMLELIQEGTPNIVCAQPFGCLPNHIVGKGMLRKIKDENPTANIVSIDYDASASRVNQENRIKLMLANATLHQSKTKPVVQSKQTHPAPQELSIACGKAQA